MTTTDGAAEALTPYRYQLVGPAAQGTDSYLLVDTQSPDTPSGTMGAVIATISDAGLHAQAIVQILNADEGRLATIVERLVDDEPF